MLFLANSPGAAASYVADNHLIEEFREILSTLSGALSVWGTDEDVRILSLSNSLDYLERASVDDLKDYISTNPRTRLLMAPTNGGFFQDAMARWAATTPDNWSWMYAYGYSLLQEMQARGYDTESRAALVYNQLPDIKAIGVESEKKTFPLIVYQNFRIFNKEGKKLEAPYSKLQTISIYRSYYREFYGESAYYDRGVGRPIWMCPSRSTEHFRICWEKPKLNVVM